MRSAVPQAGGPQARTVGPNDPTVAAYIAADRRAQAGQAGCEGTEGSPRHVGRFVVLEPKVSRGATYAIGNEITVGRAATCTIPMPDDSFVSQLHARVFRDAGDTLVEDLGSTNGTYVNGKSADRARTHHER